MNQPEIMILAVTGEFNGVKPTHFLHLKRDGILADAVMWEPGFERTRPNFPEWPSDPAVYACQIIREFLEDGVGKAKPHMIDAAIVYLFATSPDPENVAGPSTLTILPDGFEVTQNDADLEKMMNYWQEKFSAVPAEDW